MKQSDVAGITYIHDFIFDSCIDGFEEQFNCTFIFEDGANVYMAHLFHFLEYIIAAIFSVYDLKIATTEVDCIVFPNINGNVWEGNFYKHNLHLMKAIFPNLKKIYSYDLLQNIKLKSTVAVKIEREKMDHMCINKMNAVIFSKVPHYFLEKQLVSMYEYFNLERSKGNEKLNVLYIARKGGVRILSKKIEENLENTLQSIDSILFKKVYMEDYGFWEQASIAYNVDLVIGVHGNGLSHVFFMKPCTTLIEIFPRNSFAFDYYSLCKIKNIEYHAIGENKVLSPQDYIFSPNVNRKIKRLNFNAIRAIIKQKLLFFNLSSLDVQGIEA